MINIKIYTLANPFNNQVFYVGQSVDMTTRIRGHISLSAFDNLEKRRIVSEILFKGGEPIMEEIDSIDCEYKGDEYYANEIERYWIGQFNEWGFKLCNIQGLSLSYKNYCKFSHLLKDDVIDWIVRIGERLVAIKKSVINSNNTDYKKSEFLKQINQVWREKVVESNLIELKFDIC